MSDEFFYDVIELLSIYLKEARQYIVVVLDEYEHVFSWKSNMARKKLYADIKWFTEGMDFFSNLFFVFGESESAESRTEIRDDPAWVSRKPNLTCQIADISSEGEVERLFEMILKRYQKYYSVSFEEHSVGVRRATRLNPCDFKGFQRHLQSAYVLVRLIHLP